MLLSIIIPTYNSSKKLKSCIDSIINQSITDFEILIIDGISNDDTLDIARSYNDERIKIISEPDRGIYDAMNKGIEIAKGKWLYFLGSDDELYCEKVLEEILKFDSEIIDILYGNVCVQSQIVGELYNIDILLSKNICHQSIFYKNEVFKKIGKFKEVYVAAADWQHNIRWMKNRRIKSKYVSEIVATYNPYGFSSYIDDKLFHQYRNWNRLVRARKSISLLDKLRGIKIYLIAALKNKRATNLLDVIYDIPSFLFNI
ncbi:glycosyltransferase family 2 protein [Pedobacter sp. Leaf170]|uniref:glycosyltransferase family 2 protein n=1 Tax=Pedobacter sp. Leaf170 TaxID=2876558 RepID=UPI001E5878AD|nr:glycosyltransferase family 2 protein [Pedobacter sp. Leaf170]